MMTICHVNPHSGVESVTSKRLPGVDRRANDSGTYAAIIFMPDEMAAARKATRETAVASIERGLDIMTSFGKNILAREARS